MKAMSMDGRGRLLVRSHRALLVAGGGRVAQSLLVIGLSALAGRRMSIAEFGEFNLALAIVGLVAVVGAAGQGRLALADASFEAVVGNYRARLWLVTGFASIIAFAAGGYFALQTDNGRAAGVLALCGLTGAVITFLGDAARADGHVVTAEALTGRLGGPAALLVASALLFAPVDWNLQRSLGAVLIAFVVIATVGVAAALRRRRSATTRPTSQSCVELFVRSRWLWASQLVSQLMQFVDIAVAGWLLGPREFAAYSAARLLAMQSTFFLQVSSLAHAREASALLKSHDRRALDDLLWRAAFISAAPAMVLVSLNAVLGGWLLETVFGSPAFRDGFTILVVLAFGFAVNSTTGIAGFVLNSGGSARAAVAVNAGAFLGFIPLGVVLGREFGGVGVAAANTIVAAASSLALALTVHTKLGVRADIFRLGPLRR